jgi:hypothetical protein
VPDQNTRAGGKQQDPASPPPTQQSADALLAVIRELQRRVASTPEEEARDRSVAFAGAGFSVVDNALRLRPAFLVGAPDPASGPRAGKTTVTFSGLNLLPGATVSFGGTAAEVTVKSSTEIEAITPAASSTGPVDVTVRSLGGERVLLDAFTYTAT